MKTLTLLFLLAIITTGRAAEVVLDLSGKQFGPGKEIHVNSGLQRLPASAAYEFEFTGSMHGTGLLATQIPNGTTFQELADGLGGGVTIPTSGIAPNPTGKLPFGVFNESFSGDVPVPNFGTVPLSVKIRGGVASNGAVFFDMTGLDIGIPGAALLGSIVLESGTTLTIRSLFEIFAGTYCGQISADTFAIQHQGLAKIVVTPGGLITGQVRIGKATYRIQTGLDQARVSPEVPLAKSGLRIQFTADENDPSIITATLRDQGGDIGTVELKRGTYIDGPPTVRAGNYTALLHPPTLGGGETPATHPAAPGYLIFKVTSAGLVNYSGRLCDGRVVAGSSLVTEGDRFSIFATLSSGFGGLFGEIALLAETEPDDLAGTLSWKKPGDLREKVFPLGVDEILDVQGSRFIRPDLKQRALAITDGTVSLTAGNLPTSANVSILLSQSNKILAPATLKLTLNTTNGLLTGTYKPAGGKPVKLFGVILQKQNHGGGSFLGNPGGSVPIEPGAFDLSGDT